MPFLDVPTHKLRVFHVVNPEETLTYPVSSASPDIRCAPFNPSLPNLIFLHATGRSVAAFSQQFADPRLKANFNLVGIAARFHGRTEFFGEQKEDYTLEGNIEGILGALDALELDSYFLFGEGIAGCHAATTIAIRRPQKVLKIILASPGRLVEAEETKAGLKILYEMMCVNKDGKGDGTGTIPSQTLHEGLGGYSFAGLGRAEERQKEHHIAFQMRYGTGHDSYELRRCFQAEVNRIPIPASLRAELSIPVLILQGGRDLSISPLWAAEEWQAGFKNAPGGAELRTIVDGPHLLSLSTSTS